MRARDYWDEAAKLRAEGTTTGEIIRWWVRRRGMHPRVAARLAHGLTQQQAADRWNKEFPDAERPCTAKQVSNWETAREPSRDALNRLARIYHCAAGDLVEGEDWSHLDGRPIRPGAVPLSVAVAVVTRSREVLLVQARGGGWQFPSGVVKPDQDAATRAVEEAAAETGVRCRAVRELGGRVHPVSGAWCEYFLAEYLTGELVNGQPGENSDVTWAPLNTVTRFIQRDRIFRPVLDVLEEQMSEPTPEPTVAMAIVTSERGVLLARRHDGKPLWTFIGGGIEDGESPSDAAVREVKEETGLAVEAGEMLGRRVHPKTGAAMAYVACSPANGLEVHVGDPEDHVEVRWMPWSEAEGLLPHLFEPVADHLRRLLG